MQNFKLLFDAVWKILAVGLVLGAGLPAIFASGIKAMAYGMGGSAEIDTNAKPHPVGRVIGIICFALVAVGIIAGLEIIIGSGLGKQVSFQYLFPILVDKKH